MTIKKKIISSSVLLMLLFLAVGASLVLEYSYLSRNAVITNQFDKQSVYLQMLLRGMNEIILNEERGSADIARRALQGFESIHADMLSKIDNPGMRSFLTEDIHPQWEKIKKNIEPFLRHHYLDIDLQDNDVLIAYGRLIANTEEMIAHIDSHTISVKDQIRRQSRHIRYGIVIAFMVMLVVIGIHLYRLHKSVSSPIRELIDIAEGFNRGDLSITMDESRHDEFGTLARHFNKATMKLNQATQQAKANSEKLSESNSKLQAEIAERKQMEKHMMESYQMTHEILEMAPLGIYLCESTGVIEYVNKAMLDISGETHQQFVGMDVHGSPVYNENGLSARIQGAANGIPFEMGPFEYTSYHGKKTSIIKIFGMPFEEEQEKKALIFVQDLTELHNTREELLDARNNWEETFNSITDMITVHDRNFNIIGANEAARDRLRIPDLEINKKIKCYDYYHGKDAPPGECPNRDCLKTKEPATFELFEPHLNTHVEIRSIPRLDENNELIGLIHVCRDIADRKKDQELISTQINRLSALRSIDRAILGSIDMRMMLDVFLDQVQRQLQTDAVSVLLLNHTTHMLENVYRKGFRSQALKHTRLRLGQSYAGRAAVERRVVSVADLRENSDGLENARGFEIEGFISYWAVPLVAKGDVKGVLEVFSRSRLDTDSDWLEFLEAIADQGAIAIDNATMFDKLQRSNIDLSIAYDNTIEGWSRAMDMRDRETEGHSQRVTELTIRIAQKMGISDEYLVHIRRGALLHDMGKLGIPDSILLKPGKLNEEEWAIMKKHPEYAYEMLFPIEYLRPALEIPYYHHEKWDGTGYPDGLQGENIPLAARIFAVVDVWDALCSDRPYRPAWPKEKVLDHIRSLSGSHFDAEVVEVFFQIYDDISSSEPVTATDGPAVIAT